jgi:Cu(I)/Ag(I) efflux system membrane fusion protein
VKPIANVVVIVLVVAVAAGAGYWWGARNSTQVASMTPQSAAKADRKILYYRNPMGQPDTSPVPKKSPDGMDYIPVYADEAPLAPGDRATGKILYYRNPMGLPDTSPVPKKDPMGMDYIPVYEGGEPASGAGAVKISVDKVQKLGVRTEAAALRGLVRTVRAVGVIEADERRLHTVSPRFEGWIQRLYVNTTGQPVRRGEPLMEVYSPDLVAAQQEYLIAWRGLQSVTGAGPEVGASMRSLIESALQRLRNLDISEEEVQRLQTEGKARQVLVLRSPANGVVLEKPSVAGMRFMPGEVLYRIADLSSVWLIAEVFEQDLGLVRQGQPAKIGVDAYPGRAFDGKVSFVYPTFTAETRTGKVRVELPNPGGALKPAMYAQVEIAAARGDVKTLSVPDSAVLDTGTRQVVLVQRGEGLFEPRPVKLGMRADGYVQVLEGLSAGENVVVSANFLIDAESNLKAALGAFGTQPPGSKPANGSTSAPAGSAPPAAPAGGASPPGAGKTPAASHQGH